MTRWGLCLAAGFIALSVWGCVLLAFLLRPVVLVPTDLGGPLFAVCREDSLGYARVELWPARQQ